MRVLVTGGGGFLGEAIVRRLVKRGDSVRSLSRRTYASLTQLGAEQHAADVADVAAVERAADACDMIFHVAAKAGFWGPASDYWRANVLGTRAVLAACRTVGVPRLIYTSSPSVIGSGHNVEDGSESLPYASRYSAEYPRTKAIAEAEVLAANGPGLATVALRPHLIWGPGDNHLIPRVIARARSGQLRIVGEGTNRVDVTYIDNAADAHLLAADRLVPDSPVAGKAYFISQGEPVELWPFINQILALAGAPAVTRRIPFRLAFGAGWFLEVVFRGLSIAREPRMTRFLAEQLSTSHWFNLSAARRDLGYQPSVSTDEGLRRLGEWLHRPPQPASSGVH